MNVLIVEDEGLAAERLQDMLKELNPSINVLYVIDTVAEASVFMDRHHNELDIVFLDIQLADGKSFEIFNRITYNKPVIFTTAYDEYALNAFKVNSIDYLLKPVRYEELDKAISKYKELHDSSEIKEFTFDKNLVDQLIATTNKFKKRFLVKYGNKIQFKGVEEAALFSAEDKLCYLHSFQAGKRYIIDHTLDELESRLLDPDKFFRVSRKHILNLDAIREVKSQFNHMEVAPAVPVEDQIRVSRSKMSDFKNWLDR